MLVQVQVDCPCGRTLRVAPGGGPVVRCWDCRGEVRVAGSVGWGRWGSAWKRRVGDLVDSGLPVLILFAALLLTHAPAIPHVGTWGVAGLLLGMLGWFAPPDRLERRRASFEWGRGPTSPGRSGLAPSQIEAVRLAFAPAPSGRVDGPHPLPPVSWCWPSGSPSGRVVGP